MGTFPIFPASLDEAAPLPGKWGMSPFSVSRRDFLARSLAASALAFAPFERLAADARFRSDPFQLGVASGEPAPDGFVLWTRVAPEPLDPAALGTTVFELEWQVASDPAFARVVASGTALARPHLAHAVHVEVGGLAPGSEYFYRFRLGGYGSPVGRALTTPPAGAPAEHLRFAITSCAHYEQGFFSAYRYIAADRPDLVLALGDYIYEASFGGRRVRLFGAPEAVSLDDYRLYYCQYRLDPDLQAAHAACPWLLTWDDHEVENDYVEVNSEHALCGGERVREAFPARRAAAYKAWFEHMPVRPSRLLPGPALRLWDTVDWGSLARFYVLDTRQFRSRQACSLPPTELRCDTVAGRKIRRSGAGGDASIDPSDPACRVALEDPSRTFLGEEQERWLDGAFAASRTRWNLIAQAVVLAPLIEGSAASPRVRSDTWSGYPPARERLLASLARHRVTNPVVLTGDVHAFAVNEVADARDRVVASEFVTTSITADLTDISAQQRLNPRMRYQDSAHNGYVRFEVDPDRLRAELVGLDDVRDPRSGRATLAAFEVGAGDPRPRRL
jgi:alkaline phosphatase D